MARTTAITVRSTPIDSVPMPSQHGVVGGERGPDCGEREHEADEGAEVLEEDHRELRVLRPADELPPTAVTADVVGLDDCGAEGEALQHDGEEEDADGDLRRLHVVGVADLGDALVDGEGTTEAEQHEGDDEGPEVALAAVAERVRRVGRPPGSLAAEQQQALVPGVGDRVDGLREHRGRAGDDEADELGDGDAGVRQQRGDDRLRAVSASSHAGQGRGRDQRTGPIPARIPA